jgi:hypothetical protein
VYFCSTGGYYSKESSDDLELHLLVSFSGTFANLVNDGVDQPSRECTVALRLLFSGWIETIIRIVTIQKPMRHQLLHVVEYLLR